MGGEVKMDRQDVAATIALLAHRDGHTVEQRLEDLVFTLHPVDWVMDLPRQPDAKPRSKRGQRVRRWR